MLGFRLSTWLFLVAAVLGWYIWKERKKPMFPALVYSSTDPTLPVTIGSSQTVPDLQLVTAQMIGAYKQ